MTTNNLLSDRFANSYIKLKEGDAWHEDTTTSEVTVKDVNLAGGVQSVNFAQY
jgi:hypothetical protein